MAHKQALHELQNRLAERLLAVRTQAGAQSWLAIECAGQGFLISLQEAGEIFSAAAVVALPYAQPWCLGVANLRGQLHTVVDLGAFLGLPPTGPGASADTAVQLLAFSPALEINAAFKIDRLAGLRDETQMFPQPFASSENARSWPDFAGARLQDEHGRAWQELKLAALAHHEAFLKICA